MSGIQKHSRGEFYPQTVHFVGGFPAEGNYNYYVVSHPCGVQRKVYKYLRGVQETFAEAQSRVEDLLVDYPEADYQTAFELALRALEGQRVTGLPYKRKSL